MTMSNGELKVGDEGSCQPRGGGGGVIYLFEGFFLFKYFFPGGLLCFLSYIVLLFLLIVLMVLLVLLVSWWFTVVFGGLSVTYLRCMFIVVVYCDYSSFALIFWWFYSCSILGFHDSNSSAFGIAFYLTALRSPAKGEQFL